MRILQLCKKSPTPQKDGESIAIHQVTKALCLIGGQVDVLAMLTTKHPKADKTAELKDVNYSYVSISTDISLPKAILSLPQKLPYIVSRFVDEHFEKSLIHLLQKNNYDYIVLEGVFLGLYLEAIKKHSAAKIVLRAHNVEHLIWKRLEEEEESWVKKAYLKHVEIDKFEKYEQDVIGSVDGVISISPIDNQYFIKEKAKNTLILPVCVEEVVQANLPATFSVGFLGGMDWLPNRKGVDWFLENVWPSFHKKFPSASFNLAGRNFPKDLMDLKIPGVVMQGEIENAHNFIGKQSLMIAPIFSGSGMRVKIIEAMSLGKVVLSTKIGAEGIAYKADQNILIADTAADWLAALERISQSKEALEQLGTNAKLLVEEVYLLSSHAAALQKFLKAL